MADPLKVPLNLDALRISNMVVTEADLKRAKQRKYNKEYWRKNKTKLTRKRSSQYRIWLETGDNAQKRKTYQKKWYQKKKREQGPTTKGFIERLKKLNSARIAEQVVKTNVLAKKLRALG